MTLTPYQWLGAASIALIAGAFGLTAYILTGHHSKKETYVVAGTVLALMLVVTLLCAIIYKEYR